MLVGSTKSSGCRLRVNRVTSCLINANKNTQYNNVINKSLIITQSMCTLTQFTYYNNASAILTYLLISLFIIKQPLILRRRHFCNIVLHIKINKIIKCTRRCQSVIGE